MINIPLLYWRDEGAQLRQGLNYNWGWNTKIGIVLLCWRFCLYFRVRSKNVGGQRVICSFDYLKKSWIGKLSFDFDTLNLVLRGQKYSYEFLEDVLPHMLEEYNKRQDFCSKDFGDK